MGNRKERNLNLDYVKILACIAVVGLHTLQRELSLFNSSLYYLCGFAVPVFFMASGYILLKRDEVKYSYSLNKILYILRIVVLWNALILILRVLEALVKSERIIPVIISFPLTVIRTLLQRDILWQFWYLGALIIIYALLPIFMRVFKSENKEKKIFKFWIVLVCISIIFQGISLILGFPIQKKVIQTFRLWTWIQYFILGGLISFYGDSLKKYLSAKTHKVLFLIVSVWILVYQNIAGRFFIHDLHAEYFYDDLFTIVWVILGFTYVMRLDAEKIWGGVRWIQKLVPLTMGIYIIHPLFIRFSGHFIEINTIPKSILFFIIIILVSACTIGILRRIPFGKYFTDL